MKIPYSPGYKKALANSGSIRASSPVSELSIGFLEKMKFPIEHIGHLI
jgi:hypothetical protein